MLHFFRRGMLQRGEQVLVNGASGAVGTAAVQLARYYGAHVTGVCSSANLDLIKSLGAEHVIDYTQEDFTKNGKIYDVIVDAAGTAPFSRVKSSLRNDGRLLKVLATLPDMLLMPWVLISSKKKLIAGPAFLLDDDLRIIAKIVKEGKFKPVIDRCYAFEKIQEAHRYVDAGHKKGNVVITLEQSDCVTEPSQNP